MYRREVILQQFSSTCRVFQSTKITSVPLQGTMVLFIKDIVQPHIEQNNSTGNSCHLCYYIQRNIYFL